MLKKQISPKIVALVFGIIVITFAVVVYVSAWTEPGVAPPGGNVDPPLNVSNTPQTKTGALRLGGITVDNDSYFATVAGNVGIGTSTPSAKLDIVGDIMASGDITVSGIVCDSVGCIGAGGGGGQATITNGLTDCSAANRSIKTINPATGAITCEIDNDTRSGLIVGGGYRCNGCAGRAWGGATCSGGFITCPAGSTKRMTGSAAIIEAGCRSADRVSICVRN